MGAAAYKGMVASVEAGGAIGFCGLCGLGTRLLRAVDLRIWDLASGAVSLYIKTIDDRETSSCGRGGWELYRKGGLALRVLGF